MTKMEKPISMIKNDFISDISGLVNNYLQQLPLYVIEPIVANVYREVSQLLVQQQQNEREQYEKSLKEDTEADESIEDASK